jgi:hypothetical protein
MKICAKFSFNGIKFLQNFLISIKKFSNFSEPGTNIVINRILCHAAVTHLKTVYNALCTYDLYGPVRNVFDACRADPLRGQVGGGWGPGNLDFFGPCVIASSRKARAIWAPKKSNGPQVGRYVQG